MTLADQLRKLAEDRTAHPQAKNDGLRQAASQLESYERRVRTLREAAQEVVRRSARDVRRGQEGLALESIKRAIDHGLAKALEDDKEGEG